LEQGVERIIVADNGITIPHSVGLDDDIFAKSFVKMTPFYRFLQQCLLKIFIVFSIFFILYQEFELIQVLGVVKHAQTGERSDQIGQ
jgi:hypothetical protein